MYNVTMKDNLYREMIKMTKAITIDNTNDLFKIMSDRKNIKGEYENIQTKNNDQL